MPPPVPASLQDSLNKTKVEYTQLGSSGLRVSVPILGTMGIGSKEWMPWVVEEEEGLQVLKAVWDRGESQSGNSPSLSPFSPSLNISNKEKRAKIDLS